MNQIYLLYTCNGWKERSSMRVFLATTDKKTLCAAVASSIFDGNMAYEGLKNQAGLLRFQEDYGRNQVDFDKLSNGFAEEFDNENVKDSPTATDYTMAYDWLTVDADELRGIMKFGNAESVFGQEEYEEDLEP